MAQTATSKIVKALNEKLKRIQATDVGRFKVIEAQLQSAGVQMGVTSGRRSGGQYTYVKNTKSINKGELKAIKRASKQLTARGSKRKPAQRKPQSEESKAVKRINDRLKTLEKMGLQGSREYQELVNSLVNSGFTISTTKGDKEGNQYSKIRNLKTYTEDQKAKLKEIAQRDIKVRKMKERAVSIINEGKSKQERLKANDLTPEQINEVLALEYNTHTNIANHKADLYALEQAGVLSFRLHKGKSNIKGDTRPVNNGRLTQAQMLEIQNFQEQHADKLAEAREAYEAEMLFARGEALPD